MGRPRDQVEVICEVCATPFTVNRSRGAGRRFCGKPCYLKATRGAGNHQWRGGLASAGKYLYRYAPDHPRALSTGYVPEHIFIAEVALGRPLPAKAEVHHVDENGKNNRHGNLVICEDHGYHRLLHVRARIIRAGGHPQFHKICGRCRALKDRGEFSPAPSQHDGLDGYCRACRRRAA